MFNVLFHKGDVVQDYLVTDDILSILQSSRDSHAVLAALQTDDVLAPWNTSAVRVV